MNRRYPKRNRKLTNFYLPESQFFFDNFCNDTDIQEDKMITKLNNNDKDYIPENYYSDEEEINLDKEIENEGLDPNSYYDDSNFIKKKRKLERKKGEAYIPDTETDTDTETIPSDSSEDTYDNVYSSEDTYDNVYSSEDTYDNADFSDEDSDY